MKYRHVNLFGLQTFSADQTEVIDIDLADPISRIILDVRVKNGSGADSDGHPAEAVSSIELVDGSEVLFGITGLCAHALDIYSSGQNPRGGWFNYLPTTYTDMRIAIDFGRYLYDPTLALDPTKFRNLQLKITHDVSAGGMNPSENGLAIYADVFDEKAITPTGFLMTKEIKSWSGNAGEHEYTDLPTDFPYRKLLIQGLKRDDPPHEVIANIKLSEDQDKRVIINDEFRALMFGIGRTNAYVSEILTSTGVAAKRSVHITPTMDVMATANQWRNDTDGGDIGTYNGDGGQYEYWCELAQNTVHHISGWAPHGVLCIPFGDQNDPTDWFDVTGIGNLKLDITDGKDTTVSKIFIQQVRSY